MNPSIGEEVDVREVRTDIGIKEIEDRISLCVALKEKHGELEKEKAKIWHQLEEVQLKLGMDLEALGMREVKTSVGNFSFKDVQSYKVPKDDESRELFFKYLREKGVFNNLITVNSMTLNSFANQEEELALEEGNFDFQIPGIARGEVTRKFSMTQTRRVK